MSGEATPLGIEPLAPAARTLGFRDFVILWGDLGIGLLVLLAGSLLVPGLGLPQALSAILLGSAVGVTLLALAGLPSSRAGVPTMVVLRGVLGVRGSYVPSAINVLQLLGWTVFELVIMGHAANVASRRLLGLDAYPLWLAVFAALVIGLALWGPAAVIRRFLGRFAVWIMLATSLYLTWVLVTRHDVAALWAEPGRGGFPGFWLAVDIVIAMPVSWMPLVGDYSRLARRPAPAAWGTAAGYFVANVWFYALGALILLAAGVSQEPRSFVEAIMVLAGPLALIVLLVDETDEAWADLYSCAVSLQNVFPRAPERPLIAGLGVASFLVALALDVTRYEHFLLLVGSIFVPLFGVLAAETLVLGRRLDAVDLFAHPRGGRRPPAVRWAACAAWALGVLTYQGLAGNLATVGVTGLPWLGASVPSFLVALAAQVLVSRVVEWAK